MNSRLYCALAAVVLVTPGAAWAQGKSLDETLGFIRDQLAAQGMVTYTAHMHDSADNQSWDSTFTALSTNQVVDAANCRIGYHWRTTVNDSVAQDMDTHFDFAAATGVSVVNREEEVRTQAIGAGHATWTAAISPQVWVVVVKRGSGGAIMDFTDENVANRVARAVDHALDLCGAHKESF